MSDQKKYHTAPFLFCSDPFQTEEEAEDFMLHNRFPRFLSHVYPIAFEDIQEKPKNIFYDVLYLNTEGQIEVFRLEVVEKMDTCNTDELREALYKMHDWYFRYLAETDEEESGTPGSLIKDFHADVPGLKVLHSPDRWTIVVNGVIADFDSEESLDSFLEKEFEISTDILDKGLINEFK